MKIKSYTCLIAALAVTGGLHAQTTYTWTGGAGSNAWSTAGNWDTGTAPASGFNSHVVFSSNTGMTGSNIVSFTTSQTLGSITVDMAQLAILGSATRTITMGNATNAGHITLTSAYTTGGSLFSNGTSPRLKIEMDSALYLTNDGTGQAGFDRTHVQTRNTTGATPATVYFQGSGSWFFGPRDSYLGRQNVSGAPGMNVVLGDAAQSFTGVVRYASPLAMDVDSLSIASGEFRLEGVTPGANLKAADGIEVGTLGRLSGAGEIDGSLTVNGTLIAGLNDDNIRLSVNGDITLTNTATMQMKVVDASTVYGISGTGVLSLGDSVLMLDVALGEYSDVVLYSGFSAISGSFSGVSLNGSGLTDQGSGLWGGVVGGYEWSFDEASGLLNSTVVPEPSTLAALLGATVLAVAVVRRRRKACRG